MVNEANLFLNPSVVPDYGFGLITPVWLAYASSWFYQRAGQHRTEPVFFMGSGFRASHLTVESKWELARQPPRMLVWMCDFTDGNQYREEHGTLIKERLPAPFDKPTTNAFYEALSWTNLGPLRFPLEWRVVQYKPNFTRLSLEPTITTWGHTLDISNGTSLADFHPEIPLKTRVVDRTLESQGVPLREVQLPHDQRTAPYASRDEGAAWLCAKLGRKPGDCTPPEQATAYLARYGNSSLLSAGVFTLEIQPAEAFKRYLHNNTIRTI